LALPIVSSSAGKIWSPLMNSSMALPCVTGAIVSASVARRNSSVPTSIESPRSS
jgi:hypothetical protein